MIYEPSVLSTQEDGIKSLNTGGGATWYGGGATWDGGGAKALSGTRLRQSNNTINLKSL